MLKQLRLKFIGINMLIVTVMLCIIFGLVLHFTRSNLEEESIHSLQTLSQRMGAPGRPDLQPDEGRLPYFTLQLNPQGKLFSAQGNYFDLTDEALLQSLADRAATGSETGVLSDYSLRYYRQETPMGLRITFADISPEQTTMKNLARTCILIGFVSLVAFFFISLLLAKWAVKPVAAAWQEQKQFVADASHELKTPLTVIMTNAELLQSEGYNESYRQQFAGNILTTARQMRSLTESLLELARSDGGSAKSAFTTVDFSAVVNLALLVFEPVCFEKGLTLSGALQPGLQVVGSETLLHQCVDILLDNAAKYCAPGGCISVSLVKQGNHCLLRVDNPGEDLSKEDLKNIFKRFYRVDKARSRDGSYGLGLAIALAHITQHGGKIWAESQNGINSFFIQLPVG